MRASPPGSPTPAPNQTVKERKKKRGEERERKRNLGRTEVEEELREDIQGEETAVAEMMISEADTDEEDGQGGEAHELDGLPTDGVDGGDGDPIAGDGTGADQDQVADGVLAEDLEHVVTTAETDVG